MQARVNRRRKVVLVHNAGPCGTRAAIDAKKGASLLWNSSHIYLSREESAERAWWGKSFGEVVAVTPPQIKRVANAAVPSG